MNYIHNYKMLALCMILSIGLAACAGGDNISENGTEDLISRPQITDSSATLTDEMVIDIRFAMESKVAKKLGNVESLQVGASVSIGSQNMAESQQTISNALLSICGAGKASKDTAGNHICACSAGAVNIGGENKLSKCECSGLGLIQNGTDCLCDYENGFEGASEIGCECKYGFALNNDYICVPILENTVQVDCGAFEFDSTKEKCKCEGTGVTFAADYWSCFTCDASKGLVPDDDELGCKCDAEIGMIGNGVNTINGPEACVCDENNDWHQTNENPLQCIYQNCGYGIFDSDTKKCIADESKGLTLLDDGSYNCNAENNQTYINGSCQCKPGYTLTVFEEKSEKPFSEKECRKIPKTIEGIKLDIKTDYWTDDIDPDEISVKFTMGEDELKEPITYEVNLEDDAVKIEGSIAADKTITAQFDGDKSWKALRQLLLKELEINEVELKFDNKGDAQWPIEGIRLSIKYLGEADWKTILYNPCIKRKLQKYRSYASTWDEYWAQYDLADRTQYKNIIKASIYDVSFCFEIDISSDPNSEYNGGHDKLRLAVEMKEEATEAKEYEKKYDILWQSYDDLALIKRMKIF
ncbi:hypothetical protein KKA47_02225 [bacterium]|nr:hypothetical protein [bacterium]